MDFITVSNFIMLLMVGIILYQSRQIVKLSKKTEEVLRDKIKHHPSTPRKAKIDELASVTFGSDGSVTTDFTLVYSDKHTLDVCGVSSEVFDKYMWVSGANDTEYKQWKLNHELVELDDLREDGLAEGAVLCYQGADNRIMLFSLYHDSNNDGLIQQLFIPPTDIKRKASI